MLYDISEYEYIVELLATSTMVNLLTSIRKKKSKRTLEIYEIGLIGLEYLLLVDAQLEEILESDSLMNPYLFKTGEYLLIKTINEATISQEVKDMISDAFKNANMSLADYIDHLAQAAAVCKYKLDHLDGIRMEAQLKEIVSETKS